MLGTFQSTDQLWKTFCRELNPLSVHKITALELCFSSAQHAVLPVPPGCECGVLMSDWAQVGQCLDVLHIKKMGWTG